MADYREHLFTYQYDGREWGFSIMASSRADALARLREIRVARYDGELVARVAAVPAAGLFVRLRCWLHNLTRAREAGVIGDDATPSPPAG